jgi:hypothetical protein
MKIKHQSISHRIHFYSVRKSRKYQRLKTNEIQPNFTNNFKCKNIFDFIHFGEGWKGKQTDYGKPEPKLVTKWISNNN